MYQTNIGTFSICNGQLLIQIFWNKLTPQNGHMFYFLYRYTFIVAKCTKTFRCLQLCKPSFPFSMLLIWCYFNLVNLLNSKATIFMNFKFHGFKLSIQLSGPKSQQCWPIYQLPSPCKGRIYIFPQLFSKKQMTCVYTKRKSTTAPLLSKNQPTQRSKYLRYVIYTIKGEV